MPITTVMYGEDIDSATLVAVSPLADDQHVRINGDNVVIPPWAARLFAAYFIGENASLARLIAPSFRDVQDSDFEPLDIADEPSYPLPIHLFTRQGASGSDRDEDWAPIPLEVSEGLQVHMAESDAGIERLRAMLWLGDRIIPRPVVSDGIKGGGRVIKSRGVGSTTVVAESITNVPLTRNVELRAGWWALGGFYPRSAGCIGARAVVPGMRYRPGAVGGDTVGDPGHPVFRNFGMGTLAIFYHDNPPTYDWLATSADTSEVVDEDLMYLGEDLPSDLADAFGVRLA